MSLAPVLSPSSRAKIVAETYAPETSVEAVARRHGLDVETVKRWRRELDPKPKATLKTSVKRPNKEARRRQVIEVVAESMAPGVHQGQLAEAHGIAASTLSIWRSRHRAEAEALLRSKIGTASVVPASVELRPEKKSTWNIKAGAKDKLRADYLEAVAAGLSDDEIMALLGISKASLRQYKRYHGSQASSAPLVGPAVEKIVVQTAPLLEQPQEPCPDSRPLPSFTVEPDLDALYLIIGRQQAEIVALRAALARRDAVSAV